MRIHVSNSVLTSILLVLAVSNVTLDVWLWFRVAIDPSAPGRVRRVIALLGASIASITYLIGSLAWLSARPSFSARGFVTRLYVLIGLMPAVVGVMAGLHYVANLAGELQFGLLWAPYWLGSCGLSQF